MPGVILPKIVDSQGIPKFGEEEAQAQSFTTHLIEGDGTFNAHGLDNFIKKIKLEECGLSYAIVAIMGPQSSGKSTLLNHLFHTNFTEMNDAAEGRPQTTKGIWIARCAGIKPCTIAMDLEGTDGQQRGEDDTTFERQSALFAIAVSHIFIINMWCTDVGREHAVNKPLLKIMFQAMFQLFPIPRKTTLMFVIRDKSKNFLESIVPSLKKFINEIWDSVRKPEAHKDAQLSEFFNVEIVGLSHYELQNDQFKAEVASLRQKFFHSTAHGGLAGDRKGVVPGSGFSFIAQKIWTDIKENKHIDMPAQSVMMANVRCEEFVEQMYSSFAGNKEWLELEKGVKSNFVSGFGKKLSSLLDECLSNYDREAFYYDGNVGSSKRKQLEEKVMKHVQPAYTQMSNHIKTEALKRFITAVEDATKKGVKFAVVAPEYRIKEIIRINRQCEDATSKLANWDVNKMKHEFSKALDSLIPAIRADIKKHEVKIIVNGILSGIAIGATIGTGALAVTLTGQAGLVGPIFGIVARLYAAGSTDWDTYTVADDIVP